jgi:hypothetical protein
VARQRIASGTLLAGPGGDRRSGNQVKYPLWPGPAQQASSPVQSRVNPSANHEAASPLSRPTSRGLANRTEGGGISLWVGGAPARNTTAGSASKLPRPKQCQVKAKEKPRTAGPERGFRCAQSDGISRPGIPISPTMQHLATQFSQSIGQARSPGTGSTRYQHCD